MSLFTELKRRNVFRVGIAYIVAGWVLVEAATLLLDVFEAPEWSSQLLVGVLALGFPIALIFAWAFELTPEGLKRESEVDRSTSITHETAKRLDLVTIALLIAAIALVIADRFVFERPAASVKTAPPVTASGEKVSIAVLPFVNMSGDEENEYFSDGISEELLNLLARIDQLEVASRTSSFSFKGHETPVPEIAGQLGVRHILEGSVRKQQGRVRITAQLIDAASDRHLWSQTYDRELSDIFAIQDEIASQITEALRSELGIDLDATAATGQRPTENMKAYEQFLQGRELWLRRGQANLELAMERLQTAAALDPGFAEAWAQLAATYTVYPNWSSAPNPPWQHLAEGTARLAIGLDERSALAHAVIGSVRYEEGNFAEAYREMADAREADPNNVTFQLWSTEMAIVIGHVEAAREFYENAIERDPLSPRAYLVGAWLVSTEGDLERSVKLEERARQLGIGDVRGWSFYYAVSNRDFATARTIMEQEPDDSFLTNIGFTRDGVRAALDALEDPTLVDEAEAVMRDETRELGFIDPAFVLYCELLGLDDLLVEAIREYGENRPVWQGRLWIPGNPLLDDPRVVDWVSQSSLMPAWLEHGPPDGCRIENDRLACERS